MTAVYVLFCLRLIGTSHLIRKSHPPAARPKPSSLVQSIAESFDVRPACWEFDRTHQTADKQRRVAHTIRRCGEKSFPQTLPHNFASCADTLHTCRRRSRSSRSGWSKSWWISGGGCALSPSPSLHLDMSVHLLPFPFPPSRLTPYLNKKKALHKAWAAKIWRHTSYPETAESDFRTCLSMRRMSFLKRTLYPNSRSGANTKSLATTMRSFHDIRQQKSI